MFFGTSPSALTGKINGLDLKDVLIINFPVHYADNTIYLLTPYFIYRLNLYFLGSLYINKNVSNEKGTSPYYTG
jgi:hypothetical protein